MALPVTIRGGGVFAVYEPDGEVLSGFFWDRSKFGVIQGPIGSGTSSCCCHKIWVLACEQEPDLDGVRRSRWIVARTTYKELRETTIKTWLEWFPENVWGGMIRAEPAIHRLVDVGRGGPRVHPSGDGTFVDCEVIFLALPDPDVAESVLASYEITGFFVNEGQFFEKAVIDELLSRCSRYPSMKNGPGATWYGGFMDMNAPVEGHWVPYMRGDLPLPVDMDDDEKAGFEKPDEWGFFVQPPGLIEAKVEGKVVYQPNPLAENQRNLKESYLDKIKGKPKAWIDRRVLNKVGLYVDGKAVYPTFSEVEHVAKRDLEAIDGAPIIVGLDFGREPAAAFCQCVNGRWVVLSELIGQNESAQIFAPKVKRHLAQKYPGFRAEFWGDPRGADGGQNMETTAYDVFNAHGMRVLPATTDNNPEMRRSTVEAVLQRRNGLLVNPACLVSKTGFAGGYHYPKVKGISGVFQERPRKNRYSHIIEAIENALLGGGEGDTVVIGMRERSRPSPVRRHKIRMRR